MLITSRAAIIPLFTLSNKICVSRLMLPDLEFISPAFSSIATDMLALFSPKICACCRFLNTPVALIMLASKVLPDNMPALVIASVTTNFSCSLETIFLVRLF